MRIPLILAIALFCHASHAQLSKVDPPRAWTGATGVKFTATLLTFDGANIVFKMANGQQAKATSAQLSAEDQQYLVDWQKKQPIKFTMPDIVGVGARRCYQRVCGHGEE